MEIGYFEISQNHHVTLHMQGMPQGATPANTRAEIDGVAQNQPMIVSFESQKVVFNAGGMAQEGFITLTVHANGTDHVAVSTEPYHMLTTHPTNPDRAMLSGISSRIARPGAMLTIRGTHLNRVTDLSLGIQRIATFGKTATTITFRVPKLSSAGTHRVRYKDIMMGAMENSNLSVEYDARPA